MEQFSKDLVLDLINHYEEKGLIRFAAIYRKTVEYGKNPFEGESIYADLAVNLHKKGLAKTRISHRFINQQTFDYYYAFFAKKN